MAANQAEALARHGCWMWPNRWPRADCWTHLQRSISMSDAQEAGSKKIACGICGILIGGLGVHRFLLEDTKGGILRILLCLACGLGGIIGLIEGIIYLTKSDEEFYQTYMVEKKEWF